MLGYSKHGRLNKVMQAQSTVRAYLAKKATAKRKTHRKREDQAAATIQQFYRKNHSKKEYQELGWFNDDFPN